MIMLYTKAQLLTVFSARGIDQPVPKKGQRVIANIPLSRDTVTVFEFSPHKGTYGDRLYSAQDMNISELMKG